MILFVPVEPKVELCPSPVSWLCVLLCHVSLEMLRPNKKNVYFDKHILESPTFGHHYVVRLNGLVGAGVPTAGVLIWLLDFFFHM